MSTYPHTIALWQRSDRAGLDQQNQGRWKDDTFITNIVGLVVRYPYTDDPEVLRNSVAALSSTNRSGVAPPVPKMFTLVTPLSEVPKITTVDPLKRQKLYFTDAENHHNPFGYEFAPKPAADNPLRPLDNFILRVLNIMNFNLYPDFAVYRLTDAFMGLYSPLRF